MRASFLILVATVYASAASAQYGGGGGGGGMGMGRHGGGGQPGTKPSSQPAGSGGSSVNPYTSMLARAYDEYNPILLMLAAASDLKLVDSQEVRLYDVNTRFRDRDRALSARLDSITAKHGATDSITGAVHDNRAQVRTDALATMTHSQQKTYLHIESKVRDAVGAGAVNKSSGSGPPSKDSSP